MNAVICRSYDGPDKLEWGTWETRAPDVGEVEIEVRAAGVNFADMLLVSGKYQVKPELPFVAGCEAAGIVRALGPGVTKFAVGDPVFAFVPNGAMAERLVAPEALTRKLPADMSFEVAASFAVTYGTAHLGLVHRAGLKKGDTLAITGAGGGVGVAAIELGKALGATVIGIVGSKEKALLAARTGADHVIDLSATPDLRSALRGIAPGGVDVVLDNVGGETFEPLVRSLAWGGRILVVGFAAGIPKLPVNLLLLKNASAIGVYWGLSFVAEPDALDRSFAALFDLWRQGLVNPRAHLVAPMSKAGEAMALLRDRKAVGKLVLVP